MNNSDTIVLIDAYAQIYRGFYAIRGLTNSKGQPTNAVFAIAKFLSRLRKDLPCQYGAFVFDKGKCAHRLEIASDYKANRSPMPDELREQIPLIRDWVESEGWPIIESEGYEADDLIAALAKAHPDNPVKIVTGDKDIAQVVDDRVRMMTPDKKGGLMEMGVEQVIEKFGIPPERIVDYLSLIGDNSDNIPGVAGVGPKTALKLLEEMGDLQTIIDSPDKISNPKLREKVLDCIDNLKRNPDLIRLRTDLPDASWNELDNLKKHSPDWEKLKEKARELELKSVLNDLEKSCDTPASQGAPQNESPKEDSKPYTPDLFDL